jgi:dihydrofolate reductase
MSAMHRPTLSLIAAVAHRGAIGLNNALLWSESEDQKHFRRVTMGCPVVMGRKTWDSLPARFRPLPGRRNVVLTRDPQWQAPGAEAVASLEAALDLLRGAPKAFVIGGAEVYALAMPLATELVLTEVDAAFAADAFFPAWEPSQFKCVAREAHVDARGIDYSFATYKKTGGD